MMDDIQDELITPGCPQCAVKHLSAALAYKAHGMAKTYPYDAEEVAVSRVHVLAARAYINLGEVLAGYRSHHWYAVGLLQMAEELDLGFGGRVWSALRSARLALEARMDDTTVRAAMYDIVDRVDPNCGEMELAHFEEARRELPHWDWPLSSDYEPMIAAIRKEFFAEEEEVSAASTEGAGKGGETDMATKKAPAKNAPAKKAPAFLKKADPKAAKAAAKGGCTKKCKK